MDENERTFWSIVYPRVPWTREMLFKSLHWTILRDDGMVQWAKSGHLYYRFLRDDEGFEELTYWSADADVQYEFITEHVIAPDGKEVANLGVNIHFAFKSMGMDIGMNSLLDSRRVFV